MESHTLPHSESLQQITILEMITGKVSSHKSDTRVVYRVILREAKMYRKQLEEIPTSIPKARKDLHGQFDRVHQSVSGSAVGC